MMDIMLMLGDFQFSVSTAAYQEFVRSTEYRWPTQERFGHGEALQYVGPGLDTIRLPGIVFPEWLSDWEQINAMRAEAAKGEPLTLIDGTGAIMGRWVIERIEETQAVFLQAGKPRRQEYTLNLRKYDDEITEESANQADIIAARVGNARLQADILAGGDPAFSAQANAATQMVNDAISEGSRMVESLNQSYAEVAATVGAVGEVAGNAADAILRTMRIADNIKRAGQNAAILLKGGRTIEGIRAAAEGVMAATQYGLRHITNANGSIVRARDYVSTAPGLSSYEPPMQRAHVQTNRTAALASSMRYTSGSILRGIL